MTDAQQLIAQLSSYGLNYADIGRAIGRDRSLIRQAANGVKPIHNAVPALRQLADLGGRVPEQPIEVGRRTSKVGGLANVRGGLRFEKDGGAHVQTKSEGYLLDQVRPAAEAKQWLQVQVRYSTVTWKSDGQKQRHARVNLYAKGYSAEALLARIEQLAEEKNISNEEALKELLRQDSFSATSKKGGSPGLSEAGKVEQYEAEFSDAAPWRAA